MLKLSLGVSLLGNRIFREYQCITPWGTYSLQREGAFQWRNLVDSLIK